MKKHFIVFIIVLLLVGCSTKPVETSPHATEPTNQLSELTDYELLRIMAEKKVCMDWLASSYIGEYPFSTLMSFSPEFSELLTRPTAADSIRTNIESLMALYPNSSLDSLMYNITDIEVYISKNVTN